MTVPAEQQPPAPTDLEKIAAGAVNEAATMIRASLGTAAITTAKSSATDIVTEVDLQAEKLIRQALAAACPGSGVVGEELDDQAGSNGIGWIVDPIDGTVNFLYDLPVVAVSIAATWQGDVVAGAVADVLRGETFTASRGSGARRGDQAVHASAEIDLALSLIATGFSYDAMLRADQAATISRVLPAARDIRCMGSAALNLCWVACGRLDGYYERDLKIYDYAAGALIATEAGAHVALPAGGAADLVFAAAPGIAPSLQAVVYEHP